MNGNKHLEVAQRLPSGPKELWGERKRFKREELYVIPELLLVDIFSFIISLLPATRNLQNVFWSEVLL